METFTELFGSLLVLNIVINGYLAGSSQPERVVHFVRSVLGVPVVSKEILSQRTADYQRRVESYARKHKIPTESAGKAFAKRIT